MFIKSLEKYKSQLLKNHFYHLTAQCLNMFIITRRSITAIHLTKSIQHSDDDDTRKENGTHKYLLQCYILSCNKTTNKQSIHSAHKLYNKPFEMKMQCCFCARRSPYGTRGILLIRGPHFYAFIYYFISVLAKTSNRVNKNQCAALIFV